MKKTVLLVHNYYQIPGGEDTVVENEKKMLEKHGHRVILYSRHNSEIKKMNIFRKMCLPFTTVFNFRTFIDVIKLIKKENIEIVHVHNTLNLISPAVYYAAIVSKVPVVQTVHNFRLLCPAATFYRDGNICEDCVTNGLKCAVKNACYRNSRIQTLICVLNTYIHRLSGVYKKINYICLTEFNKDKLMLLQGLDSQRIFVKPNFTYSVNNEQTASDTYLYMGRIETIKGVRVILEAFSKMPDKELLLAGDGTEFKVLKEKFEFFRNIKFLGYLNRESLNAVLKRTKAVVVASQWYETFGMIVIEAFAAKIPVIVGNLGNAASLVNEGVNGYKFQYDSVNDLIATIDRFENSDIESMRMNAYRTYQEKYSEDINYEILNEIYGRGEQ